jgi:hypothetical protein
MAWFLSLSSLITQMPDYQQEIKDLTVTRSLRFLCNGFKSDFATAVFSDERTIELFSQLASEFVDANIPVVDEDNQVELAMMLLESLDVIAR